MNSEEAQAQIVAGKDMVLDLRYDYCFSLKVIFIAADCDKDLFITRVKLLIDGTSSHEWSVDNA